MKYREGHLKKLDFSYKKEHSVDLLDRRNIEVIKKYVLPVIALNEGWGTGKLTEEQFLQTPDKFQNDIDATVYDNPYVYLVNNDPVALLEYEKVLPEQKTDTRKMVNEILEKGSIAGLQKLGLPPEYLPLITENAQSISALLQCPIYESVGVVLRADLQGKKTGISEKLYQRFKNGIVFGWTSNPVIVRQRKKLFPCTFYFPLLTDKPTTIEALTAIVYVGANILAHKDSQTKELDFGTMYSDYFVAERGQEYIELAKIMYNERKISENDYQRIKYVLSRKSCAGAIISFTTESMEAIK